MGNITETADLPTVIFVGPLKTGTTWIHDYLSEMDSVVLPKGTKETFFFDRFYHRGVSFYRAFFPTETTATKRVRVEVAPSYAGHELALERIAATLPTARIVLTVREPVQRSLSHYRHEVRYGHYPEPLDQYINPTDPIISRSDYPELLEEALRLFGADRVIVLDFGELRHSPEAFSARVCSCLRLTYQAPSPALLASASNEARVPRSPLLARIANDAVDTLKRFRLHWISNVARAAGLRALIERVPRHGEGEATPQQRELIAATLRFDYEEFLAAAAVHVPEPARGFGPHIPRAQDKRSGDSA